MSESYRHIVRIFGTDLDGSRKLLYGLSRIKGVNVNLAARLTTFDLDIVQTATKTTKENKTEDQPKDKIKEEEKKSS